MRLQTIRSDVANAPSVVPAIADDCELEFTFQDVLPSLRKVRSLVRTVMPAVCRRVDRLCLSRLRCVHCSWRCVGYVAWSCSQRRQVGAEARVARQRWHSNVICCGCADEQNRSRGNSPGAAQRPIPRFPAGRRSRAPARVRRPVPAGEQGEGAQASGPASEEAVYAPCLHANTRYTAQFFLMHLLLSRAVGGTCFHKRAFCERVVRRTEGRRCRARQRTRLEDSAMHPRDASKRRGMVGTSSELCFVGVVTVKRKCATKSRIRGKKTSSWREEKRRNSTSRS